MPHLIIEINLLELMKIKDNVKKEKLFGESFARLSLINNKPARDHLKGMLSLAYGDFSMRNGQMEKAANSL